ncbi:IclR family transcriptional regulator [Agrococcus sp. 1P02AA]|uniref:IclR family transcriptional regulator n=1 Tax=Agrococcus sp. 1P02AA TaxID=3132259 RepID=UPI0039A65C31
MGTVARAVRVIAAVADLDEPGTIARIASATGLPASTVHRLLALLAADSIVEHDAASHTYRVGPELYRIAARTVATVGLADVVQPILQELADDFGETVLLGRYSPGAPSLAFIGRADGNHLLQYRIELHRPGSVVWGASGKAVAAFLEPADALRALAAERAKPAEGRSSEGHELPEPDEFVRQLSLIRERGYASSEGEKLPQARGLAVPIFGLRGVEGSLTLTYPRDRPPIGDIESIIDRLQSGSARIARALGTGVNR